MLSFNIMLERLKLIYYTVQQNFSEYYFKQAQNVSHVFTALEYDSNYFGILLWKIVKPPDDKLLFRRKWIFLGKLDLSEAINWQLFKYLSMRL